MDEPQVNDGSIERRCIQQIPQWAGFAKEYLTAYMTGKNLTQEGFITPPKEPIEYPDLLPRHPSEHEDCLFLDVWVDKDVFDQKSPEPVIGTGGMC